MDSFAIYSTLFTFYRFLNLRPQLNFLNYWRRQQNRALLIP